MKSSSSLQAKIGMVLVLAGVSFLAASSINQGGSNPGGRRVETRIDERSRMTVSPMDGEMCPVPGATTGETISIPVNPVTVALVMQQAASRPLAPAAQQAAPARRAAGPTTAQQAEVAARKPLRRI